jgi:hypothetical protein
MFEIIDEKYNSLLNYILNYQIIYNEYNLTYLKPLILIFLNIFLFVLIKKMISNFIYRFPLFNIIFEFPGTFFHELSHLFIAVITLADIKSFNIFPKIVKTNKYINIKYGSVEYLTRFPFFNIFIGSAPLYLNITFLYFIYYYFNINMETMKHINFYNFSFSYLTMVVLYSSLLSYQDIKTIIRGFFTELFFYFSIILTIFSYYYYELYINLLLKIVWILEKYMLLLVNSLLLLVVITLYLILMLSHKEN